LCWSISFVDGNKRTAVLSTIIFYNLNGHPIEADQGELVALALDVAEGQVDVEAIAGTLKGWAQPIRFPED
jgi:death-on-curing protein